jgi:hypothetical protein
MSALELACSGLLLLSQMRSLEVKLGALNYAAELEIRGFCRYSRVSKHNISFSEPHSTHR